MYIVDIFYLISPTVSSVLGLCAHYSGEGEGGGGVNANKNSEFVVVALIGHFMLRGVGSEGVCYESEVRLTMSIVRG